MSSHTDNKTFDPILTNMLDNPPVDQPILPIGYYIHGI